MDAGYGSLWLGICTSPPSLLRVDPATGQIVATVTLPVSGLAEESSVAAAEGSVWLLSSSASIVRIAPKTGKIVTTFDVPSGAAGVRAAFGALWVPDHDKGELLRIDPDTGKVTDTIEVGAGPRFLAVGEGSVWVLNQADGTVSRVDPTARSVAATITVDTGPVDGGDMAAGGGFAWARVSSSLVAKIDPRTNTVVARYGPASGSGGVIADGSATWITAHDVNSVWRFPAGS